MKSIKGILFIILIMGSSALLWYFATPIEPIHAVNRLSHIIGGMAITCFFLVFLLATRMKILERWFHGLENVYFYHKCLAIFSLVLVIIHGQLQDLVPDWDKVQETPLSEFAKELGSIGQYGFITLILIALFAKFLKYEHWRIFHRLMLIPYTFGIYHAYFSSRYDLFQPTPLGIFTAITATIGFMSALYMLTMYQDMFFKYKGNITGIKKLGSNVIELELTLDKKIPYRHGQFIFIKILQDGFEKAPHPFSISGGDGKKIFVTIKVLGDFTKNVYESVQLNTPIALDGPFGHLNFDNGTQQQIWIAGGIGITPFLSYLQSQPVDRDIELFYTYHGQDNASYKEFLQAYAKTNQQFSVNFIDTSQTDRLSFENFLVPEKTSIFMCGPEKMVKRFAKQLKSYNTIADIEYESFKIR
ncbi:ferric reductase-like transmembrane domain-containing protein [Lysinibacillus sp. G4S2]|uniref:ferredoxin reductase family protein n=1 Tax=Lysinibacillus sp. G4S2 TaxID=3055859 RepID=UPI0025A0A616|nr:ferric reductase-like transmembrane domain-containing protein [Lysinibacillus sp. G4S2]MDM5247514.1 ferric reductase-like transmembrane domain-containing protein [Lysinibacillus sp. G4S2]